MSTRVVGKMTNKNQIIVPAAVRRALCLENGESLVFAIGDDGVVTVSKAVPLDVPFAEALGRDASPVHGPGRGAPPAGARGLAPSAARRRCVAQRARDDHQRRPPSLASGRTGERSSERRAARTVRRAHETLHTRRPPGG
jgi:hypothetical protein